MTDDRIKRMLEARKVELLPQAREYVEARGATCEYMEALAAIQAVIDVMRTEAQDEQARTA